MFIFLYPLKRLRRKTPIAVSTPSSRIDQINKNKWVSGKLNNTVNKVYLPDVYILYSTIFLNNHRISGWGKTHNITIETHTDSIQSKS